MPHYSFEYHVQKKCLHKTWGHEELHIVSLTLFIPHGPLPRYVKLWVAHAPRMPGTFSLPPRVSDPGMHHGTCVMHVGIANKRFALKSVAGETFPAFPAHAQPAILRIWYEAHEQGPQIGTSVVTGASKPDVASHLNVPRPYWFDFYASNWLFFP